MNEIVSALNRQYESMTRVMVYRAQHHFAVRVWRSTLAFTSGPDEEVVSTVKGVAYHPKAEDMVEALSKAIDSLSGVAAYEILDGYGNGAIVYPDWE